MWGIFRALINLFLFFVRLRPYTKLRQSINWIRVHFGPKKLVVSRPAHRNVNISGRPYDAPRKSERSMPGNLVMSVCLLYKPRHVQCLRTSGDAHRTSPLSLCVEVTFFPWACVYAWASWTIPRENPPHSSWKGGLDTLVVYYTICVGREASTNFEWWRTRYTACGLLLRIILAPVSWNRVIDTPKNVSRLMCRVNLFWKACLTLSTSELLCMHQ